MGDINQFTYVKSVEQQLTGPFLEIGSKNYGSTQDLRTLFQNQQNQNDYVGIDMAEGNGVDLVLDMTNDFQEIDKKLNGRRFETIFCLSVLEHCAQPFHMAENLTRLLAPNGKLCVSVPFAWQFHGYPSDYWRFTHEGVKQLFSGLDFTHEADVAVTSRPNDFHKLNADIGKIPLNSGYYRKRKQWLRSITAGAVRLCAKSGIARWLFGYRYLMAPTMITMIGTPKKVAASKAA